MSRRSSVPVRLQVGDWVVAAYVGRMTCLAGPAIASNGPPTIYDKRWRHGFVEKQTIIFYGDEQAARRVFDELERLDRKHYDEVRELESRQVKQLNSIVCDTTLALKAREPSIRAEVGHSKIYACFQWAQLNWSGRDAPELDGWGDPVGYDLPTR